MTSYYKTIIYRKIGGKVIADMVVGVLLLITFIGLIVYCFKDGSLLIGFITIAVLWCIIGLVPLETAVNVVLGQSVESYGKTIVITVFGAWFGWVLVDTGIAGYVIKKTVEFASDKPLTAALLLNIVCTLIFCSTFGVGSVMAIGMIVLPIMFSVRIDKKAAVDTYMLVTASGMYLNIAYVNQFFVVFPNIQYDNKYIHFAVIVTIVSIVVMIAFIVFNFMCQSKTRAFAAPVSVDAQELPFYCILVSFVPIIMISFFKWQPVPTFLLGILLGLLFTRNLSSYSVAVEKVRKTLYGSVADSGLLTRVLYGVNIFRAAAKEVAPIPQNLLGELVPQSPLVLLVLFCILVPLALFRGPPMIWGPRVALASILQAMGIFTEPYLFMLFLIPPVSIMASVCPTQSWATWTLSYSKLKPETYVKTNLPWDWIAFIVTQIVGYFTYSII